MFGWRIKKPDPAHVRDDLLQIIGARSYVLETLRIEQGAALAVLAVPATDVATAEVIRQQIETHLNRQPGIKQAQVVLTAERAPASPERTGTKGAAQLNIGVKWIVAVASGKGGVGKSTVAANLAVACARAGIRTGLLDADIYGPSMPMMMGQMNAKPEQIGDKQLKPVRAHGVDVMSIGFMVDPGAPMIWRGPMVQSAIVQMLRDVDWSGVDLLIVDMPPGTGDAQLTMAQKIPLAGAIIVSTPQDVALIDARKGLAMFQQTAVPILGVVENMSVFTCPHCGNTSDIFGHGGAKIEAERCGVAFLGEIPLDLNVRLQGDAGTPIVAVDPGGAIAQIYNDIAARVMGALQTAGRPAPTIKIVD